VIDLFCRVVDNFGDAGVCFRLARQLVREHGHTVRLFIDQPEILEGFAIDCDAMLRIHRWNDADEVQPAPIVLATFCCRLPEPYITKMAAMRPQPTWINIEYLSAESWVESHHGLPSIHPATGLREYFFYPGFTTHTGGLLREGDALARMDATATVPNTMWTASIFCYPTPAFDGLLEAWNDARTPVLALVPEGKMTAHLGLDAERSEGCVTLRPIPFQTQDDYDGLLARCDFNVVRGEDSFVRAQWAAKPFLWHIYPQHEAAHLLKLEAFLTRVADSVGENQTQEGWHALVQRWNRDDAAGVGAAWPAFASEFSRWRRLALAWRKHIIAQPDLITQLLEFAKKVRGGLE
jgi:uncharacterized repeat protein (TIGR03837 family)